MDKRVHSSPKKRREEEEANIDFFFWAFECETEGGRENAGRQSQQVWDTSGIRFMYNRSEQTVSKRARTEDLGPPFVT